MKQAAHNAPNGLDNARDGRAGTCVVRRVAHSAHRPYDEPIDRSLGRRDHFPDRFRIVGLVQPE